MTQYRRLGSTGSLWTRSMPISPPLEARCLTSLRVAYPPTLDVPFVADQKGGPFDIRDQAREWLLLPANPNGRTNADVLKPWLNGMDLTRRPAGKWIVDFGWTMSDADAALYEEPFRWVKEHVYPCAALFGARPIASAGGGTRPETRDVGSAHRTVSLHSNRPSRSTGYSSGSTCASARITN